MRHLHRACATVGMIALFAAPAGAQLLRSRPGQLAATALVNGTSEASGSLDLAHSARLGRTVLTSGMAVSSRTGERWGVRAFGSRLSGNTGWGAQLDLHHLRDFGFAPTGSLSWWGRRGGVVISGGVERGIATGRTATGGRPYVIGPVVRDTMTVPHDTLSPAEAAERERGSLMMRGTLGGVLTVEGVLWSVEWQARVRHALTRCCGVTTASRTQAELFLERSLVRGVSLVMAAGTAPAAVGMLSPSQGSYLNVGIGLRTAPRVSPLTHPGLSDFRVDTLVLGLTAISVAAPGARRLELRGSVTEWQIRELRKGPDGRWHLDLPLATGIHRISIRRDGGAWSVPPGLAAGFDDFGEAVGVLIIAAGDPD